MNKALINKICSKFGFELNGLSYMQALRRSAVTPDVFQKQKELLNGNVNVIFDLGANYGGVTKEYKKTFPHATVYAFEPFPEMFKKLSEYTATLSDVHLSDKAISDRADKRIFFVNESVDTNSLLESQATGMRSDEQVKNKTRIEVETISLDEFCRLKSVKSIDILKMDIQGGELDALKGAASLLQEKKIGLIYTETNFIPQYVNQPLFQDLLIFLEKKGYQLQDIYNPYYGKGSLAWCDAIFLPRK